jgi:hypothetical protein
MSSNSIAFEGGGDTACISTELIFAIFNEIGASTFIQRFIDDDQEDESVLLLSKMKPERIMSKCRLPRTLDAAFVIR